jgi:hypothetical protein
MTDPYTTPAAPAPAPKVSFFEDLIDIFFSPAAVFRRRENSSAWLPMLFVAAAIGLITFATFNTIEPIFSAEFQRNSAKVLAKNPQMTPEMMSKGLDYLEMGVRYGASIAILVTMFLIGSIGWLLGKAVGSKQTYGAALVVAGWAYMPRVLGSVIGAVQGLLMDPAKLNGAMAITLSPARFMDPDTANPLLLQLAGRFDLITIWVTVLLAIGLYVTGKVTKDRAVIFGILIWLVGGLQAFRTGYTMM